MLEQQIEQFVAIVLQHRNLACQRYFDRAFIARFQQTRVRLVFLAAGVAAGERFAAVAHVLIEQGAGKAEGAGIDRFTQQRGDLLRFLRRGGALERGFAHDIVAKRCQRCEKADVQRRLGAADGIHVLRESLPIPGDAFFQHIERDRFDVHQIAHGHFARGRAAGCDADAAIAEHHTGYAMPGRGRECAVPANLRVVVSMGVNETGRDDAVGRVDHLRCAIADLADCRDLATGYGNVRVVARRAAAVDDGAVLDE